MSLWPASSTSVGHFLSTSRRKLRRLRRETRLRRSVLLGALIEKAENLERTQPGACIADDGIIGTPWTSLFAEPSWISDVSSAYGSHSSQSSFGEGFSSYGDSEYLYPVNVSEDAATAESEHEPYSLSDSAAVEGCGHSSASTASSCVSNEASDRCHCLEPPTLQESFYSEADPPKHGQTEADDALPSFEDLFYEIYGHHLGDVEQRSSSHSSVLTPL
ncbi:hypothetical protein HPB50_004146 [Hyalomma asiaticum]|uniref:Uncharacterized protein n=1 Tax=Hyalomma asiaticum TaxID=266040 RepID=A0ACB7SC22_HYAAI|nr:hypothetical protein HPB50_004146 [Hyalomma asiaticum]